MRRLILLGSIALIVVVAVVLIVAPVAPASACADCKTPGYWKNHPCAWPVSSLTIGGHTYTKAEILGLMKEVPGDKSYTLFRALVAAKLNVLSGCEASCCVQRCICQADHWLSHWFRDGITASSWQWQCGGERLYWCLDAYNNS